MLRTYVGSPDKKREAIYISHIAPHTATVEVHAQQSRTTKAMGEPREVHVVGTQWVAGTSHPCGNTQNLTCDTVDVQRRATPGKNYVATANQQHSSSRSYASYPAAETQTRLASNCSLRHVDMRWSTPWLPESAQFDGFRSTSDVVLRWGSELAATWIIHTGTKV